MADTRNPGDEGSMQGDIKTPMSSVNVGRKNTPGTEDYKGTFNKNSPGGGRGSMTTGSDIMGPGEKNSYEK